VLENKVFRVMSDTKLAEPARRRGRPQVAAVLASVVGVLLFLLTFVFLFGWASGEEFSPQTFTSRSYSYLRIPMSHIQIWRLREHPVKYEVATYLRTNKYIPSAPGATQRWDLVRCSSPTMLDQPAPAAILVTYLVAYDSNSHVYFWKKWTRDHKKLAAPLWSVVARVARENHYSLLPPLFDAALVASDPKVFARQLDKILADEYQKLAEIRLQQNDFTPARQLFRRVLELDPKRPDALRGLERCRNDQSRP